jgi:putative endopeptidase
MKYCKLATLIAGISLLTASCKKENEFDPHAPDVLVTNRDTLIDPSEDFFTYANGGWFKKNPIPASERSNGIFRTIGDTINSQIKQICEKSAAANAEKGTNKQKIGDFYASGMDTITIDKLGITPLKAELAKIDAIKDVSGLLSTMAYLHTVGANPAFSFYVGQDDKNSTKYALFFSQGGLGMGNRDYYFNTDKETVTIRNEYVKHLEAMSKLMGNEAAAEEC